MDEKDYDKFVELIYKHYPMGNISLKLQRTSLLNAWDNLRRFTLKELENALEGLGGAFINKPADGQAADRVMEVAMIQVKGAKGARSINTSYGKKD